MKRERDRGYAMLAAILGIAAFSYVAFEAIAENRGIVSIVQAENERSHLRAASDAGFAMAIAGLGTKDKKLRWLIDGTPRKLQLGNIALTITVEDERGKIPLNGINADQVRQLFIAAGVQPGSRLDALVDSYEDWLDPDNDRRPNGAEAPDYASRGYAPRNGSFHTVSELRMIKGMDDALYARIAPAVTVFFGESGGFSESTAQLLALEALGEEGPGAPEVIERAQELAGINPAPDVANPPVLVGRTLTIRVEAKRAGADMQRSAIVELTGNPTDPIWFRKLD